MRSLVVIDPKADSVGTILYMLRRILQLSDNATLQDIIDTLAALEQQPAALTALSALLPSSPESDEAKIDRLLQVTPEMKRRWAA